MRKILKVSKNEKGGSAVEFALLLPVLMIIIMGIIQFGFTFFHYISIVHAAREGARWASLENTEESTISKVIEAAPGLDLTAENITVDPPNPSIEQQGEPVKVTVDYDSIVIVPFILTDRSAISLLASATQKIE